MASMHRLPCRVAMDRMAGNGLLSLTCREADTRLTTGAGLSRPTVRQGFMGLYLLPI
jgi:hypothetical protein